MRPPDAIEPDVGEDAEDVSSDSADTTDADPIDVEPDADVPVPDVPTDCDDDCALGEACDATGTCRSLAWSHTLHLSENDDTALGVAVDSHDNIYVTGCRDDDDPAVPNVWLSKYDRFGDLLWTHETDINDSVTECGLAVVVDGDDAVVLLSNE